MVFSALACLRSPSHACSTSSSLDHKRALVGVYLIVQLVEPYQRACERDGPGILVTKKNMPFINKCMNKKMARNLGLGLLLSMVLIGCGRDREIQEIMLSAISPSSG